MKAYYDLYDLPHIYLKIEGEFYCHAFSILFIIFIISMFIFGYKQIKDIIELKKINKILKRKIQKHLMILLDDKKNEKAKNLQKWM